MSKRIETIEELAEAVKKLSGPVAVISHVRPDADAVGSAVGLVELLRTHGLDVFGMTPDPVPEYLRFMLADTNWREPDVKALAGRTVVSVDVPGKARMGFDCVTADDLAQGAKADDKKVFVSLAIDHHASHMESPFAQSAYVKMEELSTCQIISALSRMLEGKVNPVAAQALYSGIITDTLNFTVGNANEGMMAAQREGSWLISQGADALGLSQRFFGTTRKSYLKVLSLALERAEYLEGGKLLLVGLSDADLASVGATDEDRVKLAGALMSIEGVEISAFVHSDGDQCKANLRGRRNEYRIDLLAATFGGGGHMKAAGLKGNIKEPLETFLPRLRAGLVSHWKTYGQTSGVL